MDLSEYVTIVVVVPETHADLIREVMGQVGAGETEKYSHCSFSVKGISRFMPKKGANPFIGSVGEMEQVVEERIETICQRTRLEKVIEAIQDAHPYEQMVVDIYPVFQLGCKGF